MSNETETSRMLGRGGRATIRALIEFHGDYLFGIARALVGDARDAEKLVGDTLTRFLEEGLHRETSVRTSLLATLVREASEPRLASFGNAAPLGLMGEAACLSARAPADPVGTAIAEARPDLSAVLRGLSMEHRIIIVLRELAGMTYQEMACTLKMPQAIVRSRLCKARDELSKRVLLSLGDLPADRRHAFTRP